MLKILSFTVVTLGWPILLGVPAGGEVRLVGYEPLPQWDSGACVNPSAYSATAQAGSAAASGGDPLRVVRDPYPSFSGVWVDVARGEVFASDENLSQILVYERTADTPPAAPRTEPRRRLAGERTRIQFVSNVYVSPEGELYATLGDETRLLVFSREQNGDVAPVRELRTPKARSLAVDERHAELFLVSQHDSALVVFRKQAEGREAPIRLLQGERTMLANPHGIAVDRRNELIFVTNHGQKAGRSAEGLNQERRTRNWPLDRSLAVPGSGRFNPPSISVHRRVAEGDEPPVRVISGPRTQLNWPAGIVVDEERGELVVANDTGRSVLVFRSDAEGDVAPIRVLKGPATALESPTSVFLDAKNNELWVANFGNHALTVYPRTAQGDMRPLRTIRSGPAGSEALMIGNPGALAYDAKRAELLVPN
jgi:DNA-binding beta-propeller fold protein YncE